MTNIEGNRFPGGHTTENLAKLQSIPEYPLAEGVQFLVGLIESKRARKKPGPVIVAIAGRTGSGKTTVVAAELKRIYGDKVLKITMDDYFRGGKFLDDSIRQGMDINRDHPLYVDLELLRKHLEELRQNRAIEKPVFKHAKKEREGSEKLEPSEIIVVEGLFALREEILDLADVKAFVDVSLHEIIIRRILRDASRFPVNRADNLSYILTVAEPMYQKYIETTRGNADLIISNEHDPSIEARECNYFEAQIKFEEAGIEEKLRELGAEILSEVYQADLYIIPRGRRTAGLNEHFRIREEGERLIFTYEGPKGNDETQMRPKVEFEINKRTYDAIFDAYTDEGIGVMKNRKIYSYGGLIVNLDSVVRRRVGEDEVLGNFVEIVYDNNEAQGEAKAKGVCERLELPYDKRITASYIEYKPKSN